MTTIRQRFEKRFTLQETRAGHPQRVRTEAALLVIAVLVYLTLVIRRAWLGDDIFITLRVIDNFVSGYGPVFNPGERVQAYSHPLWMLLLTLPYLVTREPYFTTLVVSMLCSVAAVWVLAFRVARKRWIAIGAVLTLAMSNAFVDYSTSGLENPLTFLLLAVFCWQFLKGDFTTRRIFWLSFVASLAGLNRLDTILLFFPALVVAWLLAAPGHKLPAFVAGVLGQLPLIVWELFSLIYYGFPFPNTYYAKLGSGVLQNDLSRQGVVYFLNSLERDPITIVVVVLAVLVGVLSTTRKRLRYRAIAVGLVLYLVYIVRIGGDFMTGRFFAAPLFLAVLLLSRIKLHRGAPWVSAALVIVPLVLGYLAPLPTFRLTDAAVDYLDAGTGIIDERLFYFDGNALASQSLHGDIPHYWFRETGERFAMIAEVTGERHFLFGPIGMIGYYGGPSINLVDHYGLVDPLRARLPAAYRADWRVGHYIRHEIIEGYDETLVTGINQISDPNLHTYYDYLSIIVHDPIWSVQRFKTIINMNLGRFDHLIDTFYYRYPEIREKGYSRANILIDLPVDSCEGDEVHRYKDDGLLLNVPERFSHSSSVTVALQAAVRHKIDFYRDGEIIGSVTTIHANTVGIEYEQTLSIPKHVSEAGFDQVHFLPLDREVEYCLAYLTLNP